MARDETLWVVGLISGTSADGIDGVCVRLPRTPTLDDVRVLAHHHQPLSETARAAIFGSFDTARATADVICRLNAEVGEWFATAALETIRAAGLEISQVDLIASHGQTIYHDPPAPLGPNGSTLQIGEPSVIAERTGVTTVADFRVRDMAAGGHGAPLVSFLDDLLFRPERETRVLLNLGGIGNITMLPPRSHGAEAPRVACDTGPANMVLDWIVGELSGGRDRFDVDGRIARTGTIDRLWLATLLDDEYFRASAPKTTGRERYGAAYAGAVLAEGQRRGLATADIIATVTELTVVTVADAIAANVPSGTVVAEVIAAGGGARNPVIMAGIAQHLDATVTTIDTFGIAAQAKEALLFAVLGNAAVRGLVNTVPSSTGARHATVMGKIVPGANYGALMARLFG